MEEISRHNVKFTSILKQSHKYFLLALSSLTRINGPSEVIENVDTAVRILSLGLTCSIIP